jgi:MoaA/NifB/PqqE/SkfB family radical SAM enzyme
MSRSRPYEKKDNAWGEQKNWTHVRKVVGYRRYDRPAEQELLRTLYRKLAEFQDFFYSTPCLGRIAPAGVTGDGRLDPWLVGQYACRAVLHAARHHQATTLLSGGNLSMATTATPKFRIDVAIHDLLRHSNPNRPAPPAPKGATLPEPVFPRHPGLLEEPGPETPPETRRWRAEHIYRKMRGWLFPYVRSRVLPGQFHPITAYLFAEYKCNVDCWYCWSFDNKVKGMTEDIARRSIDRLHDHGCRVLALVGGEPLLRPEFAHKVVSYAANKGFWVYVGTNGRLLRPELADRLGDAGTAVFNVAIDAWVEKPGLPKAVVPIQKNLEHLMRKQHVYGYMVFFNINICRNNLEDVRRITEYAREHRLATDYHINETPMLEQDSHFKHLEENPTYIRPEDWRAVDELIDWIIEKNKAGYQMGNSVQRLQEMKAFMRMSAAVDLRRVGWHGDGTQGTHEIQERLRSVPGIVCDDKGGMQFSDWNCRAGQNNVVVRTDGTVAPCSPMYASTFDWGMVERHKFDPAQLSEMKKTCQRHCFSTLNHNLGYCYNDARVIRWLWKQAKNGFRGGARSFED